MAQHSTPDPRRSGLQDTDRRLAACLSSSRLFSLDPDAVLAETTALMQEALPGVEAVVLAVDRAPAVTQTMPAGRQAAVAREALSTGTTSRGDGGRLVAVPLCIRPAAGSQTTPPDDTVRTLGAALLTSPEPLSQQAVSVAEMLADRAAVALEHAVMYQTQASIAQELQRILLPVEAPRIEGLQIGVLYKSRTSGALIGGDFVDFVSLSPHQVAVAVGDVSGKGVKAAAFTVMTKYALRAIVSTLSWPTWPGEALRDLHNALQGQLDPESYVTVLFALIDAQRRSLSVASAGHPAPFLIRDGTVEQPLLITSPAIALSLDSEIDGLPTERFPLREGDTLLFYTDGLGELRDSRDERYEDRSLADALGRLHRLEPDRLVEAVYADALAFSARPPHDDTALVAVRFS